MGAGDKQTGNKILVLGHHAGFALAAALLRLVGIERHPLDVTGIGYGYHHFLTLDQRFNVLIIFNVFNFGTARGGVFVFDFDQLVTHDAVKFFTAAQNRQTFFDLVAQAHQFLMNLIAFKTGQSLQFQIQNSLGLRFGKMVKTVFHLTVWLVNQNNQRFNVAGRPSFGQQGVFGVLRARRAADQLNHRIEVFDRNCQTDQRMGTVTGLVQLKNGTTADDVFAELDKGGNDFFQIHHHRAAGIDGQHIHAEAGLQRRIFVQLVQNNIGLKIAFDFDYHTHALTVGLVADVGNTLYPFFFDQFGNFLHQSGLVDLIGNFVHNDRFLVFFDLLNRAFGAHHHRTAAGKIGRAGAAVTQNQTAGRKIRPRHIVDQFFNGNIRVVDIGTAGRNDFPEVVRRNVGRHTDGNAVGAVN